MSLRIGMDLDGVVANFIGGFEEIAQQNLGQDTDTLTDPEQVTIDQLSTHEMKRIWREIQNTPNWWTHLTPYEPEQIKRFYSLTRRHRWEVFFLTKRPRTAGEPVQFQTQWWLEREGFLLPSVITVPGSRGELANALKLDFVIDDQLMNCIEVISASKARAVLVHRNASEERADLASARGIGVVDNLEQAIDVAVRLQELAGDQQSWAMRWAEWFKPRARAAPLSVDEDSRELPPLDTSALDDTSGSK